MLHYFLERHRDGAFVVLIFVQSIGLADLQAKRQRVEAEWGTVRQSLVHHREARNAAKDLTQVWALLPGERDFGPLALGISDEAKREGLFYRRCPTRRNLPLSPIRPKGYYRGR